VTERITRLEAIGFRGVPERITIAAPKGESVIVLGDNGTGKSMIADAIEWFFTGQITYLAHEGRESALKHLAAREPTSVELETDGTLGGKATPPNGGPKISRDVGQRETFLLRGRALSDFVNKTKGEKWRAMAEVLGTEEMDRLRLDLQTVSNELADELERARRDARLAAMALMRENVKPDEQSILIAVQSAAGAADVKAPATLEATADPKWLGALASSNKAAVDIGAVRADLSTMPTPDVDSLARDWNSLISSGTASDQPRLAFLRTASSYLKTKPSPGRCPLCTQKVDDAALAAKIRTSLADLKTAADENDRADMAIKKMERSLDEAIAARRRIAEKCQRVAAVPDPTETGLAEVREAQSGRRAVSIPLLKTQLKDLSTWDAATDKALAKVQEKASSTRATNLAKLGSLRELALKWMSAGETLAKAESDAELARKIHEAYLQTESTYVASILDKLSSRIAHFYRRLHPNEEIDDVRLELFGEKGVEFSAKFHGRQLKPPHGVLSESHLSSLGIAVFLAMAEAFNEELRFLVLDDVITSLDISHRGALAELLVEDFKDWQLFVLTHDPLFFSQITRRAPNWLRLEFTSWSFEEGPRLGGYRVTPLIATARAELNSGDLSAGARSARRALEELLQEACEALESPLPFRRGSTNDRREIGELLSGLRRGLRETSPKYLQKLKPALDAIEADVANVLNVEAHGSTGWASRAEVDTAVGRIEALAAGWTCAACGTRAWAIGTPEASRCKCGKLTLPDIA